jgi:hypothetical protein
MWHAWGRSEMHTGFWWQNKKERVYLEGKDIDRRIISKWTIKA